ncbi:hypothetical protein KJA15_00945 [Patescibacteria group bacterium]|nr:hypothetical protein [Patescibacteria group bacterium]
MNKKILVVLIILIVLIIGWLVWKYQISGNVLITTDKTEYEQKETLRVKIKNNFRKNVCFSSCYPYYLERKTEEWKSYLYGDCQKKDLIETCVNPGEVKAFEITLSPVEAGLHRIAIPICSDCKTGEEFKESRKFYSNEFTIKEKDETANWKTYRNEEYGFEIKYPDDWHIHEVEDGYIGIVDTEEKVFPQMVFQKSNWMGVTIIYYSKPTDFTWEEWLRKRDIVGYEKSTERGLEVIKITERTGIFPGEVFFGNEKKIYGLDYMSEYFNEDGSINREKEQECLNIFNQMLSTFRLLE